MKEKSSGIEMKKTLMSQQLRLLLEKGTYLPGAMLPSERKLAEQYGMNRMAVKAVLQELAEDGYIYRVQGKGTFVQKRMDEKAALGLLTSRGGSFSAVMKRQGIFIENMVVGKGTIEATSLLKKRLELEEGETIYGLHRVRLGNGIPYAVEFTYLPMKYFPDVDCQNLEYVSLYTYMEARGYGVMGGKQTVCVLNADERIGDFLKVTAGHPVYRFEFCGKSREGQCVEYTESYIRPDKTKIWIQGSRR